MDTLLILLLVSITLSLPGNFLVIRNLAMSCDAISHTTLLGIVLAWLIVRDIDNPFLILGACATGVITTILIEALTRYAKLQKDASIGIIYSFFFALAVLLVTKFARNTHLSVDLILMGEILYATLRQTTFLGISVPIPVITMSIVLLINTAFICLFYKELKVSSFDKVYAETSGFGSIFLHIGLMSVVSLSCVVAFDSIGAVLVLAFFVCPAACSFLVSDSLFQMILGSIVFAIIMSVTGFMASMALNVSLAGMCATTGGAMVILVSAFGPHGALYTHAQAKKLAQAQAGNTLLEHIYHHSTNSYEERIRELRISTIHAHLGWDRRKFNKTYHYLIRQGYVKPNLDDTYCPQLTTKGRNVLKQ